MGTADRLPTTSGANVTPFYQLITSYGVDADRVFNDAGIDLNDARAPGSRVLFDRFERLVRLAIESTGDPRIGLKFAEFFHPTSLGALGIALLSSKTLRSFSQRLERYYRQVTTNESVSFDEGDATLILRQVPTISISEIAPILAEGSLAVYVKMIRWMYKADFAPMRIELGFGQPIDPRPLEDYFGCPLKFACDRYALHFRAQELDEELPAANAELARENDRVVSQMLAKLDHDDIVTQVQSHVIELLPSGKCKKNQVANLLNISPQTLNRRLQDRSLKFNEILEQTRMKLADQYLRANSYTITEITFLLGFSETSSFSRAFSRWKGTSPTSYRSSLGH